MSRTGPSIAAVCRVLNAGSCGSGSIVGKRNGKLLIMTNAHVAGSRIGRIVTVEIEALGRTRIQARVIMAAYSDQTLADWAVLESVDQFNQEVTIVKMSKNRPTGSHYTKGFPRCAPHNGTDVTTVDQSQNSPLWRWRPNSIGGQSGSGVWSDSDNLMYGLLTWSWGGLGAGQMTSEIYRQARRRTTSGYARPEGLQEVGNQDMEIDWDTEGLDDPIVENGFFSQTDITTLPIWAEDDPIVDPIDPNDPGDVNALRRHMIEDYRAQIELLEDRMAKLQGLDLTVGEGGDVRPDPNNPDNGLVFGLPPVGDLTDTA